MKVVSWFSTCGALLAVLGFIPGLFGCSGGPPNLPRAAEGDSLCAGKANGATTTGQPDHQGCPNTCSCVCYEGQCYMSNCTAIGGCTNPPVYR